MNFRPSLKFDLFFPCHSGKLTGEKDVLYNSFISACSVLRAEPLLVISRPINIFIIQLHFAEYK